MLAQASPDSEAAYLVPNWLTRAPTPTTALWVSTSYYKYFNTMVGGEVDPPVREVRVQLYPSTSSTCQSS
eukprot:2974878-Rhodomonas_salina.3